MDADKISLLYNTSVDSIVERNSSFDKAVLRVAYTGKNRNKTFISKEAYEKSIHTIFNVPIVCNYSREEDSIGGHDQEIVDTGDEIRLVNITEPVGVIPESAEWYWQDVVEDDGSTHEYLCVDVILWKRQEAYKKIKENKITKESMEITVKNGETVDGYFHINSFEFTAFCLLENVEPCFESASLATFSKNDFKEEFNEMLAELKAELEKATTPVTEGGINSNETNEGFSKGGDGSLNKSEILAKYGLAEADLDFDINEFEGEEFENKAKEIAEKKNSEAEGTEVKETNEQKDFQLTGEQFREQLMNAVYAEKYNDPDYGSCPRYLYCDFSLEESQVFCYDCTDWNMYGFTFAIAGDVITVDFATKKRKKIAIVDFEDGVDENFSYKHIFDAYANPIVTSKNEAFSAMETELTAKVTEATNTISALQEKVDVFEKAERAEAENELFAKFEDLAEVEAFNALRENCKDMSLEDIESKCFELRGRNTQVKFSVQKSETQSTRLPVGASGDASKVENKNKNAYSDLFEVYSNEK